MKMTKHDSAERISYGNMGGMSPEAISFAIPSLRTDTQKTIIRDDDAMISTVSGDMDVNCGLVTTTGAVGMTVSSIPS